MRARLPCSTSSKSAPGTSSGKGKASPTTKSTPSSPPAGTTWLTPGRAWKPSAPCAPRPTSSQWPPPSSASGTSSSRPADPTPRPAPYQTNPPTPGARVAEFREKRRYEEALRQVASLRPQVDRYFDQVLVMAKDEAVRENRLALLGHLLKEFSTVADFSEIVVGPKTRE